MTQYKYALLRQEPGRLVVDLNVNVQPIGKYFADNEEQFNEIEQALSEWQSSHVTIPVDKGNWNDLRIKGKASTAAFNDESHYGLQFSESLKQGILINPELIEVIECQLPTSEGYKEGDTAPFVFLREEKKEENSNEKN